MHGLKVLISGASIAGPALAFWLERYGAEVVVVEKAPQLRAGGQLVDLRGVGREVVRRMGLEKHVQAAAEANDGLSFVDARGRCRGSLTLDDFGADGPVAGIEILRGELSRVLFEQSSASVEYRFGERIAALEDQTDGVNVTFQSGHADRFDLVIGADGLHSEIRDRLFGAQQELHHLGMYLSFWTAENHINLHNWSLAYSEPGRTIGTRSILGNDKVMAFFSFRAGQPAYDWRDIEAHKRIVLTRGSGMAWEAAQLLAQIETAPDFYFDACTQVILNRWSRGHVAMLGDAAYCASPLSGHGATLAIVGAYILAGELARASGDHKHAFAAYERILRPWVNNIHRGASRQGTLMTPDTAHGIRLRNQTVRLAQHLPGKRLLIRDQINLSNSLRLPNYTTL